MDKPVSHPGKYATDLVANLSMAWIYDVAEIKSPFFLALNPVNPHGNYDRNNGKPRWTAPVLADRHKNKFPDAIVPHDTKNNNPGNVGALVSLFHFTSRKLSTSKIAELCFLGSRT